ncbi:MAG: redoxin domain-containing protein, partial [Puniceicoccales bacterium]|nr:redoxin domain-containing protein [Puniceicoccales bacterium]
MLTIGDQFPRFQLRACADLPFDELTMDTAFMDMTEETYGAKWKIYLFYPKDFTFVCPTELVAFGKMRDKFFARNAQIIGCSTDNEYVHWAWRGQHPLLRNLPFPLLADIPRRLSRALAILDDESGVCMRALYIVDEKNVI